MSARVWFFLLFGRELGCHAGLRVDERARIQEESLVKEGFSTDYLTSTYIPHQISNFPADEFPLVLGTDGQMAQLPFGHTAC